MKWRISPRRAKGLLAGLCIAVAATALTELSRQAPLFRLLELKSSDLLFVLSPPAPTPNVMLLVIDQRSLDRFPEPLLLWHGYIAEAIEAAAAAGARVLGLDVAFPIPVDRWAPGLDERLAQAVLSTSPGMPVYCGFASSTLARQRAWPVPVNMAAAALNQAAYVNLRADEDDFIRSVELFEAAGSKSLSLAVAERLAGHPIEPPGRGILQIRYPGPAGTFPRVSLCDFVEAARAGRSAELRAWVQGKAVLLGPDLITDRHATPYYAFRAGTPANTAGVEIHAAAVETLLAGSWLRPIPGWLRLSRLFLVSAAAALVTALVAGWPLAIWLSLLAGSALLSDYALFRQGWLAPPSALLLALACSTLLALAVSYFSAARRGDAFGRAVRLFVGKQVAEDLEASGRVSLSGRRELVTILFSDIRGFTAWCENHEPETVVDRLNGYFSTMTAHVVAHGGQVNKFIGDGMLAIFSDAEGAELGDHALRAVRCAVSMVRQPGEFTTGAGVHTGYAVVGNIGGGDKMDYTALGDTVNLAARLESLNKEYGTRLLFSEATWQRLDGRLPARRLEPAEVRGKSRKQALYTVPLDQVPEEA